MLGLDQPPTETATSSPGSTPERDPTAGVPEAVAAQRRGTQPGSWAFIVRPEILFLLGTVQARVPYLLWWSRGTGKHIFEITYLPLYFWLLGCLAFSVGCVVAPKPRVRRVPAMPSGRALILAGSVTVLLIAAAVVAVIRVYGGIPLLQFASHSAHINGVSALNQRTGAGRLDLLTLLLFFLNGILVVLILDSRHRPGLGRRLFVVAGLAVEAFGCLFSGNQQGLVVTIVFFSVAFCIAAKHPLRPLLNLFPLLRSRPVQRVVMILAPVGLLVILGALFALRTTGKPGVSLETLVNHIEYPLMNFEAQCAEAGTGPYKMAPKRLLERLLPFRVAGKPDATFDWRGERPIYPEPSWPTGFYGELQWNVGLGWAVVFAFLAGFVSSFVYLRAFGSLFYLLAYAQISWALVAAHSSNHFLSLVRLPLPVLTFSAFVILAWLDGAGKRIRSDEAAPNRDQARIKNQ